MDDVSAAPAAGTPDRDTPEHPPECRVCSASQDIRREPGTPNWLCPVHDPDRQPPRVQLSAPPARFDIDEPPRWPA